LAQPKFVKLISIVAELEALKEEMQSLLQSEAEQEAKNQGIKIEE